MKRASILATCSLIVLLVLSGCSFSGGKQTVSEVTGVVTNLYGEPLSGVTVEVAGLEATTTETGSFSLSGVNIAAGSYNLTVYSGADELHSENVSIRPKSLLRIFVNDDGNLLVNPGFELGFHESGNPIGWRGSPDQSFGDFFHIVQDEKRSGESALAIVYPANRTGGIHIRTDELGFPLPVSPGDVYEVTAYAYNTAGNRMVLQVIFLDADNKEISGSGSSVSLEQDTWTKLTVKSKPAPANAAQIRVMFWQNDETKGSTTYVDDVRLVKVEE